MNYNGRARRAQREHRKYNAIFVAIMALALVGGGYLASLIIQLLAMLFGAA